MSSGIGTEGGSRWRLAEEAFYKRSGEYSHIVAVNYIVSHFTIASCPIGLWRGCTYASLCCFFLTFVLPIWRQVLAFASCWFELAFAFVLPFEDLGFQAVSLWL